MTIHSQIDNHSPRLQLLLPILLSIITGAASFSLGVAQTQSEDRTQIQDMRADIQKIRAMPDPNQVVTKDQLAEIVRRLDERTEQISQDVQYLRQREERRGQ